MTGIVEEKIRRLIKAAGPLPVSDYMALCLFDPDGGYYTTREPFGVDGDFITAPEISQMFGEIVGAWLVHTWRQLGRPAPFVLAEMGPGRGTLMRDILRTAAIDPAFLSAARVHLVETSDRLASVQRETLADAPLECTWTQDIDGLPEGPLLFVANELFDAVPVRQFVKTARGWCERHVGIGDDGALRFFAGPPLGDPSLLPPRADDQAEGAIFEYAPAREAIAARLGVRLAESGGAALLIDYGHARSGYADTLQAVRAHRYVSVFDQPGSADLTSHVDFESLASAARAAGAHPLPVISQGEFLLSLGLAERAGALGRGKDEASRQDIRMAAERLAGVGEKGMGELFKVLCLTGKPMALPPFR
ncbi:class I SAM-dependent methyltransferase [Oricola thermophila]|uniref:Class I SAM-dependent methyltransferase n=1 Tax=Oricola thermophila TaxID=2742145 RepID=A0A6N1V842_9HYPH|nr:class I SAM-dependent methyltransferase [Oricola thermophila]QKV17111.1 class I SAM-dependent methyltransferase [Oricola thermophila]